MTARIGFSALAMLALASCSQGPAAITIIGSSTVYPFTTAVATAFVDAKKGPAPVVSSTGTVAGFDAFCAGSGSDSADIADASRRLTRAEYQKCASKGAGDLIEIPIGLDGIALAESNGGHKMTLTKKDLYLALAAFPKGQPNTAKTWKDVNPSLPAIPILVLGPPPSSGTRDVFEQMVLQPGCIEAYPDAKALLAASDPARLDHVCRQIRSDSAYHQEGENDDQTVAAIEKNPDAIGIFGYSFLEKNAARLHGLPIDGFTPDTDTISSGKYPATRTLYLYVKAQHLKTKPALQDFLTLYASMWNPGGPLTQKGLIAMSDGARKGAADTIKNSVVLNDALLS